MPGGSEAWPRLVLVLMRMTQGKCSPHLTARKLTQRLNNLNEVEDLPLTRSLVQSQAPWPHRHLDSRKGACLFCDIVRKAHDLYLLSRERNESPWWWGWFCYTEGLQSLTRPIDLQSSREKRISRWWMADVWLYVPYIKCGSGRPLWGSMEVQYLDPESLSWYIY